MIRRLVTVAAALCLGMAGGGAMGLVVQGEPPIARPTAPGLRAELPAPPAVRPLVPDTLLAWTPGGLPPGFEAGIRSLRAVDHVVAVASGTAWLTRSLDPGGGSVDRPPAGLAIPIEVAGADLRRYGPFLSPVDRVLLPGLAAGQAALGASSAGLRHLGRGATLVFGSRQLRVSGVLPDAAIGAHEVFVSRATAERLGISRLRYVLIDPAPGASRTRLTAALRNLLPPGTPLRVRGPGETPFFRQGDAVLPPIVLKQDFGEFAARPLPDGFFRMDPRWVATHIARARVPILGDVVCNRALIPQLRGALGDIAGENLAQSIEPGQYGGCFAGRFINEDPAAGVSHHSWGAAIDLNVSANPFGRTPHQDPRVVAIFRRWGFTWGGRWLVPDGMHFEFARFSGGV